MNKKAYLAVAIAFILCAGHIISNKSESYIRQRAVKISKVFESGIGMCSGEQITAPSGTNYILTAGHCRELAKDGYMTVTNARGENIQRRVIAESPDSDLLLVEGLPGLKGLDIADRSYMHEHIRTFTNGGNRATHKSEGESIQFEIVEFAQGDADSPEDIAKCNQFPKNHIDNVDTIFGPIAACVFSRLETCINAEIIPGSSGGMIVDDSGDLVGVASAKGESFGYMVSLSDIHAFIAAY